MIFAALIPQLLSAIMGSGAVAVPAMTAATGAAGAAGGTVGGATATAPASSATGSAIGSVTGGATDFGEATGSIGATGKVPMGGAGGMQVGGGKPLEVGPGQRYGGTGGSGGGSAWQQNTGDLSEGDPMPPKPASEWLPYEVPKSGFGRFLQRLGGNDPALGNSRYLANKQMFGEQKAMQMELENQRYNNQNKLQQSQQAHSSGESAKARQAQEEQERARRGWEATRDANRFTFENAIHVNELNQRARELAYRQSEANLGRMDALAGSTGTYDPIAQQDRLDQLYNRRANAPQPLGSNAFWSPQDPNNIGIFDRGADASLGEGGTIIPPRPPGIIPYSIGGGGQMLNLPPMPNSGLGGSGIYADPSRLQYTKPATDPQSSISPAHSWLERLIGGGRPFSYPGGAPR